VPVASARLRQQELAPVEAAGGSYLLATLANLVVKAGIVIVVGGRALAWRVIPGFGTLALATCALLFLA
jgi:uncharacterized membrane protein (DUF4010 family)